MVSFLCLAAGCLGVGVGRVLRAHSSPQRPGPTWQEGWASLTVFGLPSRWESAEGRVLSGDTLDILERCQTSSPWAFLTIVMLAGLC